MAITILGIETSCDDTSAAIIRNSLLLSNVMASQEVHRAYGGRTKRMGILLPVLRFTTDNAAMIAVTGSGYFKFLEGDTCGLDIAPVSQSREIAASVGR